MRFQTLGNKSAFISNTVKNASSSVAIKKGQPLVLVLDGTDDGLTVVLPSGSSATLALAFPFGVAETDIPANEVGSAMQWGLCRYAMLVRQTRAASTDTWASEDTLAKGLALRMHTVANAFTTTPATLPSNTTITEQNIAAWLAQTLASYASSASSTADTRTAITVAVKAFLRML